MKMKELFFRLKELKWNYQLLNHELGAQVVVSERGGRIMGVYPFEGSENMLWIHPELVNQGNEWNVGGERVWVSPEVEYNIPNLESAWESYTVHSAIDPGSYKFINSGKKDNSEGASWRQQVHAMAYRTNQRQTFQITKQCELIQDPLQMMRVDLATLRYAYIGYETTTQIELAEITESQTPLALWTIMQVPAGGEVIIPTFGIADVEDFFAPTGPSHLFVAPGEIRFKLDAKEQHKISVKALSLTGRIGYYRQTVEGSFYLIVRNIQINPSGSYRDVPIHHLADQGHCIQCYNDDGQLGAFGELEYHTPVMKKELNNPSPVLKDISQVWCYSGDKEAIEKIAFYLLGAELKL